MEPSVIIQRRSFLRRNWIVLALAVLAAGAVAFYLMNNRQEPAPKNAASTAVIYTCPMHPQIQSDKPGQCPICGMALVPKRTGLRDSAAVPVQGSVTLSADEAIKANVQTVKAEQKEFVRDIQAVGTIKIAEPGEHLIASRTRGRIERLYVNATGKTVRKGDALYDYYSPDLQNAEQEYLIAKNTHTKMSDNEDQMHGQIDEGLIAAGKQRLRLYGMSNEQIADLEKNGKPGTTVTIRSPESGIVLQKFVQEGSYVDEGTSLFQLADMSVVWAEIQIPESDIRFIREGYPVSISTAAYPSEKFGGKVIFISPVENSESRTITVRLALPNTNKKLRPEMFISAAIHIAVGSSLAVPAAAVVRTGEQDHVWIRNSDGSFSSRIVTIGALSDDNMYQVLSGLKEGDEVALSGQFLIDSEHQFASGSNPMAGMNMDAGDQKSKSSGEGTGIVRSIDKVKQTVTIDHGNIPGVMSAMTMGYKVKDPALLEKAHTGDRIRFILSRSESGEYLITSIITE